MKPYYDEEGITIYLGDCLEVMSEIPANSVNTIVTSPPYNNTKSLQSNISSGMGIESHGFSGFLRFWKANGYSDNMPEDNYQQWQNKVFAEVHRCCVEDASLFYNHQLRWRNGKCIHPMEWFRPKGWKLRQEIIWNRGGG